MLKKVLISLETKVNALERLNKGDSLKNTVELHLGKINVRMGEIIKIQGNYIHIASQIL